MPLIADTSPVARAPLILPTDNTTKPPATMGRPSGPGAPAQDVQRYQQQIQQTYATQGAAVAAKQLAQAEADPLLTTAQRQQLLADSAPVVDKIAQAAGQNARRTDLPAQGPADKTTGIDTQDEYKGMVLDLSTAVDSAGDDGQAQHVAQTILRNTPAPGDGGGAADKLDLLGKVLADVPPEHALLRNWVAFTLNGEPSNGAPAGSVLNAPADLRAATAATIAPTLALTGPGSGNASDPASSAAYTKFAVEQAKASKLVADRLQARLGNTKPEDDPAGWAMYATRRTMAGQDQAKAEQAIAAQLRLVYAGHPGNRAATENTAHGIASEFRDDPAVQTAVANAQNTVFTETPQERETHTLLNGVNRKAATLDDLTARQQEGDKSVTPGQIAAARSDYEGAQHTLLQQVRTELDDRYRHMPEGALQHSDDPLADVGKQIADRYAADPELRVVTQAAIGIHRINASAPQGSAAQIDLLGRVLPKGVDPSVKRLVMADAGVQKAVNTYVDDAAAQVDRTYHDNGTVAGANALRDVTDPAQHAGMTPQIAALIINKAQPTIEQIVNDEATLAPKGKDGQRSIYIATDGVQVADALSQAVDVAAAGSDVVKKQYDTPEIQRAIEGTAQIIATHPCYDIGVLGFKDAVGNGYATLALQTAASIKTMREQDVKLSGGVKIGDFEQQRKVWESTTLGAIDDGLRQLQDKVNTVSEQTTIDMAPVLAEGKHAGNLTEAQFQNGVRGMVSSDSALADKIKRGYQAFDELGYRLVRTSEAVEFYRKDLGGVDGYAEVDATRNKLLSDDKATTIVLASDSASRRMATQVARTMLGDDLKNGKIDAQKFGIGGQVGDMAEFLAETYVIKGVNLVGPGGSIINLSGASIDVSRSAHLPFFAGAGLWGLGGGMQAALTAYVFDNVHIDGQAGGLRKGILLGLVGGFAAFHLMQAGMAAARIVPHSFGAGDNWANTAADKVDGWINKLGSTFFNAAQTGDSSWGLYVKEGSARDRWTRLAVEATPGLIKQLVGLMAIATVWDLSGVFFNATQLDGNTFNGFKLATQGTNLAADGILLRLQVREMALRAVGKTALQDPAFAAAAEAAGLDMRGAAVKALEEGSSTSKWNPLASSKFLNWFEGTFGNKAFAQEAADATLPGLRQLLFKTVVGESGEAAAARFALLGDNPIGWAVNIAYMATTVANWAYDHNKAVELYTQYDRSFLQSAGLDPAHADVMDKHHWWSGNAKVDGFLKAYQGVGGDPAKFIDYVNGMDTQTLDAVLGASENMDDHLDDKGNLPVTQDDQAFLALPFDPTKVDVAAYTTIRLNGASQRYEDPVTQTYWDHGIWRYDPRIGNNMGEIPARTDGVVFYNPATLGLMHDNGFEMPLQLTSQAGWENWMRANAMPMPPRTPVEVAGPPNSADFLALPQDPGKVDPSDDPRYSVDPKDQRLRDSRTHMSFSDGRWYFDPAAAGSSGNPYGIVSYDPATRLLHVKGDRAIPLDPKDTSEYERWIAAGGQPRNGEAGSDNTPQPDAVPTAPPVVRPNGYVVKPGDSVWKIAGNDPTIVARIYALNPWLNPVMASDNAPVNRLPGQNPNFIDAGEKIILPDGYRPASA